jgi:hypothetical protein
MVDKCYVKYFVRVFVPSAIGLSPVDSSALFQDWGMENRPLRGPS